MHSFVVCLCFFFNKLIGFCGSVIWTQGLQAGTGLAIHYTLQNRGGILSFQELKTTAGGGIKAASGFCKSGRSKMGEGNVDNRLKMMDGCSLEWMWPSGSPRGGGSCSRFLLVKGQFFPVTVACWGSGPWNMHLEWVVIAGKPARTQSWNQ